MGKYLHLYYDADSFSGDYNGAAYHEPWVSLTEENSRVNYNKTLLETPLTFEVLSGGNFYWLVENPFQDEPTGDAINGISYRINDGDWVEIEQKTIWDTYNGVALSSLTPNFTVSAGDVVQFKGYHECYWANTYGYASTSCGFVTDENVRFNAKGNIMSLIDGDNFATMDELTEEHALANIFASCSGLVSVTELLLPATGLSRGCYAAMFGFCGNLINSPKLPATTLAQDCYDSMFWGCTSLTAAPELPATTLAQGCYSSMFRECTSLTAAPELPATTLAQGCYESMFWWCTNLNYIKAMFTTTPSYLYTMRWVSGVASSGTFVKNAAATWNVTGVNGIPEGWTVRTA